MAPLTDVEQIRRALALIHDPGTTIEIRAFKEEGPPHAAGYFRDHEQAAQAATLLSRGGPVQGRPQPPAKGVFITINEIDPDLYHRLPDTLIVFPKNLTTDQHVRRRRWLVVDIDSERQVKGISSTEEEKAVAKTVARSVRDLLTSLGFPQPVIIDSGNGWHLYYRIDLPADKEHTDLIERCLKALAQQCGTDRATVDTTVHNPSRIMKLPGTAVRKGGDTPERPHRMARILDVPEHVTTVDVARLQALAALYSVPETLPPGGRKPTQPHQGDAFPMQEWIDHHGGVLVDVRGPLPDRGGQKWQLQCPFNPDHKSPDACLYVTASGAAAFKCSHNSCQGRDWHALRDHIEPGWQGVTLPVEAFSSPAGAQSDRRPSHPVSPAFDGPPRSLTASLLPVRPLTCDMLPPVFADWISDIAERMNCPQEYPAVAAMVALSAVVGRHVGIRPKRHDDWTVVPNLWGGVVGAPGEKKTPAVAEALKPMRLLEELADKRYQNELKEWEKRQKEKEQKQDEEPRPICRRFLTQDTTTEKLGDLLNANMEGGHKNGILVFRDELVGFLRLLEKQGREGDRQFYLECWNGDGVFTYDRIQRGTVRIKAACVSVFGTIQPEPLKGYLRGAGDDADGFTSRFQLLVYPDTPAYRMVDRAPDIPAQNCIRDTFKRLSKIDPRAIDATLSERGDAHHLRFSEDAQDEFLQWFERLERRVLSKSEPTAMQIHLAKFRSLCPSLALLFALVDPDCRTVVPLAALRQAIAWCDLLESHARRIYHSGSDSVPAGAVVLQERLPRLPNPFTVREVVQRGWAGLATTSSVELALAILEGENWIQAVEEKPTGGGRPSVKYWKNPHATYKTYKT